MKQISTFFILLILVFLVTFSSCQKDQSAVKPVAATDSLSTLGLHESGNYLATHGSLKITIEDSTYTFDAAKDSIAFVNIVIKGQQYYGITAINKAHTLSFGISSFGTAQGGIAGSVAGSQFLVLNTLKPALQYTLSANVLSQDVGKITVDRYRQDTLLARGTFKTYLAKDAKPDSPFYLVQGSFDLKAN